MKRLLVILLPLLLLGAAACLPAASLRSELFLDDDSLLTGEPCEAPCWNGIIPGETNWPDALAIIEGDERLSNVEQASDEVAVQATWQKADSGQPCCSMVAEGEDEPVIYIYLTLSPNTILDDVLDRYGEPQYVTPFINGEEVGVQLLYPDIPMVLAVLTGNQDSSVLANSEVVAVFYMTPDVMTDIIENNALLAWEGYQSFTHYAESEPIITPVPTPEESSE
ncbi:MAG: hypothetical protein JW910_12325 [Anaerolineae bacterium]|nr:hypothetical protein [Anaerolineae bacterium]